MNKTTITLFAAIAFLAGCSRPGIQGDGVIKTEDRPISEFSKLVAEGGYQIKWFSGKSALTISTDQNLLPHIRTSVSGDTLRIDSDENLAPTKGITITLSSAALADARFTGGIHFTAGHLSGRNLRLESTGAADISVAGSVTHLEANLTGASHLSAKSLRTQTATLSLLGASDAHVNVSDTLKVSITGAGSLTYSGNPKSVVQNITGAGRVQHLP